jgi:proteasome lid subunit RPN8/RPN11
MKTIKNELHTKNLNKVFDFIKDICEEDRYYESCGLIGIKNNEYVVKRCENKSTIPKDHFVVEPLDYFFFKEENKILCVYHSHVSGDEKPSEDDVLMAKSCCLPFLIYSTETKKFKLHIPNELEYDRIIVKEIENKCND